MSAIYSPTQLSNLVTEKLDPIRTWIDVNPGASIDTCATANGVSYEIAFRILTMLDVVILPSTSGEIHWHAHKP